MNLLCYPKTDAQFIQDAPKVVWSIPYVSVTFFTSLKKIIAYRSSKVSSLPDCIFEIHQLWQSGFSRVYSNSCSSCSFESEITRIGQSSHKMYSNNIPNFHEFSTIITACKNSLETYWIHLVFLWTSCDLKIALAASWFSFYFNPTLTSSCTKYIVTNNCLQISVRKKAPRFILYIYIYIYVYIYKRPFFSDTTL